LSAQHPEPESESELPSESPDDSSAVDEAASWHPPPAQPQRIFVALAALACGVFLYGYLLLNFWSSPWLGIHSRTPYVAYGLIAGALALTLTSLRISLGIWAPHFKLGIFLLAFLSSAAIGFGGGRFISYLSRGTRNPPMTLNLKVGQPFPTAALSDQDGTTHKLPATGSRTLIVVYRGDFCPFARYELRELTKRASEFRRAGLKIYAISVDSADRSRMLADFLHTEIPLLSDDRQTLLGPLGLVQHHRRARPDNALPAFFLIDRGGIVRWIFISPYYREQPQPELLLQQAAATMP
jgi:peroxiredoxin